MPRASTVASTTRRLAGRAADCGARAGIVRRGCVRAARAACRLPCTSSCAQARLRADASSKLDARIQRIASADRCLRKYMPAHRGPGLGTRESRRQLEPRNVERVQREHVPMNELVVPWRARAVVAVIVSEHFEIVREPGGVIVDPVTTATG